MIFLILNFLGIKVKPIDSQVPISKISKKNENHSTLLHTTRWILPPLRVAALELSDFYPHPICAGDIVVYTTAEIVLGECADIVFSQFFDERTGFDELVVETKTD